MVAKMIYEARALTWALKKAEFNNDQIWYCPCWFFPSYVRISVFSVYKETLTEDDFLTKYCLPSMQLSFPNLLLTKSMWIFDKNNLGRKTQHMLGRAFGAVFPMKKGRPRKPMHAHCTCFGFLLRDWGGGEQKKTSGQILKSFPKKIIFGLSRFF